MNAGTGIGWVLVWVGLAVPGALGGEPARDGEVEFSDGSCKSGRLSLSPGTEFRLQTGRELRAIPLDQVRAVVFTPEREELERKWRFVEAGKTAKEFAGSPYPVRDLRAAVVLAGGQTIEGHLFTTVLYVETDADVDKILLPAKQRGREGETLAALVYPKRISFADAAQPGAKPVRWRIALAGAPAPQALALLTRGDLARLEGQPTPTPREFLAPPAPAPAVFVAVRTDDRIWVGWPAGTNAAALARLRGALGDTGDFFDDRQVRGVWQEPESGDWYALVWAARRGETTLDQPRNRPWRLEVLRWKTNPADTRLLLAGQGYFFRGIGTASEPPPRVEISPALWRVQVRGDRCVAGEEGTVAP